MGEREASVEKNAGESTEDHPRNDPLVGLKIISKNLDAPNNNTPKSSS